jgi:hypothetical protein
VNLLFVFVLHNSRTSKLVRILNSSVVLPFTDNVPDLVAINKERPLPNYPMTHEVQVIMRTIEKGPKTKMPKHWYVVEDSQHSVPTQGKAFLAHLRSMQENESKPKARVAPQVEPSVNGADAANAPDNQLSGLTQEALLAHIQLQAAAQQTPNSDSLQQNNLLNSAVSQPFMQAQNAVVQNIVQNFNQAVQAHQAAARNLAATNPAVAPPTQLAVGMNHFNQAVQHQSSFAGALPTPVTAVEAALAAGLQQAIEVNQMLQVFAASRGSLAAPWNEQNQGFPQNHYGINANNRGSYAAQSTRNFQNINIGELSIREIQALLQGLANNNNGRN